MFVLLMLVTVVAAVALLVVLVYNLAHIVRTLDAIGGQPDSLLSKLRLGLRAIETETGHLAPQVTKLNGELSTIAGGLQGVDGHLAKTIEAVLEQEGS
ncbi:MAG: hypothetical protein ACE5IY_14965 [bacterium]